MRKRKPRYMVEPHSILLLMTVNRKVQQPLRQQQDIRLSLEHTGQQIQEKILRNLRFLISRHIKI